MIKSAVSSALLATTLSASLMAQQTPTTQMLDAKLLHATGEELLKQAKTSKDGLAAKMLLVRPDSNAQIAVRAMSGLAEVHQEAADLMFVLEGSGQILLGGAVVNGKEIAPGEIRGDKIEGGEMRALHIGDVLRIEPGVPHQVLLSPGGAIQYIMVKTSRTK